jgi:hypothetical protein
MRKDRLTIKARIMPDGLPFTVYGRDAWAFSELHRAGQLGCTPIDNPGPRWSAYVHKLKRLHGLCIQTLSEAHKGPFAGTHARYVLQSQIEILERSDFADLAVAA